MIEPRDLLGPTATLLAVTFAIFAFLMIRVLALLKERRAALSEIDVPDDIGKRVGFRIGVLGDILLLSGTGIAIFLVGIVYCPNLLYRISDYYLGSTKFTASDILLMFRELLSALMLVSVVLFAVPFVLIANDVFVNKRWPLIVRIFAGNVLRQKLVSRDEAKTLLPEARKAYNRGAFGQAILYGFTSLELELKNRFGLPADVGFGRILGVVIEKLGGVVSPDELLRIRRLRNTAAHPSPERRVTSEDAEEALSLVENILQRLQTNSQEGVN